MKAYHYCAIYLYHGVLQHVDGMIYTDEDVFGGSKFINSIRSKITDMLKSESIHIDSKKITLLSLSLIGDINETHPASE